MNESRGTLCYTEIHIFVCYSAEMGFFFLKRFNKSPCTATQVFSITLVNLKCQKKNTA